MWQGLGQTLGAPCVPGACRLLITGTMIACKLSDDRYFTNQYYAQVGGVTLEELNGLELELLGRLGFRAHVDVPELCACLQVRCAGSQLVVQRAQALLAGTCERLLA